MEKDKEDQNEEKDNLFLIALFYLLGTACFMPQNFYVTANKYWMYKFRDTSLPFDETDSGNKTTLQKNFTAYSSTAGSIGLTVFLFLTVLLRSKISLHRRIIGSMISLLVLFLWTLGCAFVDTDGGQTEFFVVALVTCGLLNSSAAVLLISVFELAARLRPRCLAAQFAGQSICGILAAVIQIIALLVAPSVASTAALYYGIVSGTIAVIMVSFIFLSKRSEEFRHTLEMNSDEIVANRPKLELAVVKSVVRKLAVLIVSLFLCVGITGILHSGITALIESSAKGVNEWGSTYFVPVCVFLIFNAFEFIGREASNHFDGMKNVYVIFVISVARMVLLPLILLCNIQPRDHVPVVFHDDVCFIMFMILLAFSSGHLLNAVIVMHTEFCEPDEKMMGTAFISLVIIVSVPLFNLVSSVFVNVI